MDYFVDYHTHSTNSIDGKNSMLEICQSAVDRGIKEIAITDHFEPSGRDAGKISYMPVVYWTELLSVRREFEGRLKVKAGIELGQPHLFTENLK